MVWREWLLAAAINGWLYLDYCNYWIPGLVITFWCFYHFLCRMVVRCISTWLHFSIMPDTAQEIHEFRLVTRGSFTKVVWKRVMWQNLITSIESWCYVCKARFCFQVFLISAVYMSSISAIEVYNFKKMRLLHSICCLI